MEVISRMTRCHLAPERLSIRIGRDWSKRALKTQDNSPSEFYKASRARGVSRRAVEVFPKEKDAFDFLAMVENLAMIAAWVGDKDLACQQVAIAVCITSGVTYGQLKLLPFWDPLRGDPR